MTTFDTDIIKRQDFPTMVNMYNLSMENIDEAFRLFGKAETLLSSAFGGSFHIDSEIRYHCNPEDLKLAFRKKAWESFLDRIEIKKIMSNKQLEEMERRFQEGRNIPEITLETIMDITFGLLEKAPEYAQELYKEVYGILMPGTFESNHHKTNVQNARRSLGKKIVLTWCVENICGSYMVNCSHTENRFYAIDKAFHILDGRGFPAGYRSPLLDGISKTTVENNVGETDFFRFKCYLNGNVHIEFKRMDLVNKLNQIAGNNFSLSD